MQHIEYTVGMLDADITNKIRIKKILTYKNAISAYKFFKK